MKTQLFFQTFLIPYLILFGLNSTLVSGQCQLDQRSILIHLKNKLFFDSSFSKKLMSWNPNDIDCCTWGGITCSTRGQVIGLDLSNEWISGVIDDFSTLFGLKNLQKLNLAENDFGFIQFPSGFGSLASLTYLNLSNSGYSGQVPGEFSQLTRLEVLDLSAPKSTKHDLNPYLELEKPNLAMLVRNLTRLRGLYLDGVDISAQKFDWCQVLSSSLPDLEVLSLSDCQLSGPLDSSLEKLKSLSVIRLSQNNMSAPVPDFFANFRNLTVLDLRDCNLHGTFPEKVLRLQTLQILDLSYNDNLHGSLPDFPMNGSLQKLVLGYTYFSGEILESIGNLKNSTRMDLHACNFSGRIPKSIENLTQLAYLDLSSNKFFGQIPSFKLCKNLTHIDLSRNNLSGLIPSTHFQDLRNLVSVVLSFNAFSGRILSSLFSLPLVQKIQLSNNNFDGLLPNFYNASASLLDTLGLSSNKLEGEIPRSFFELRQLSNLNLSSNKLNGTIETKDFQGLSNLTTLDLSFNNLSFKTSSLSRLQLLDSLRLASCNLQEFPNLRNHSRLTVLDLSSNRIGGEIPSWIWRVGNGGLYSLNLSYNQLTGLQKPYLLPAYLFYLDLHFNRLSGVIPPIPKEAGYIDYSNNLFNSSLPEINGENLGYAGFFSVSNNLLTGEIPNTICNATRLLVLDLSNNHLTGRLPPCLIEFGSTLGVLNLGKNGLSGRIEGNFLSDCGLQTLDLHGNYLEGEIPQSLANCRWLEVLNLGNNMINDTYPCSLHNNTNLRVLVLRSNRFHGSVHCGEEDQHNKWSKLQILDIALNSFSGVVPADSFWQWGAMMANEDGERSSKKHLGYTLTLGNSYYQDSVTVTIKGHELELVKILTIFTYIDISNNQFSGEIPSTIGRLKALYLLNVSHNEFTGSIPTSIGNLSQLESLDMSSNKLIGEIPSALTNLGFVSVINFSYNQLEGKIPMGMQFNTFDMNSYLGNKGLCGFPLNRTCTSSIVPVPKHAPSSSASSNESDWQDVFHGMGVGAGFLIVIAVLYSLCRRRTSGTSRQTNLSI